jgi:NADH dehydrogenase FAD-containing subunit
MLVEAGPRILGSFDATLVDYYSDKLRQKGIGEEALTSTLSFVAFPSQSMSF